MNRQLGAICGSIGLLLVFFTAPISYFTVNSLLPFIVSMVVGVICLGIWGLRGGDSSRTWLRAAFFYSSSVGLTLAFLGTLVAVNFIAARRAPSWDLTAKKIYSLSPQTESTLKELKSSVKVISFLKEEPPEPVLELYHRYAALSPLFTWEFVDPRRNPALTAKYQIREGQPAAVIVGEGEKDLHVILNLTRLMNPLIAEQELTNGIIKLQTVGTQKLYFLTGHNELSLEPAAQTPEAVAASMVGLKRVLQDEGYAPTAVSLLQAEEVPADASALIIAGAHGSVTEHEKDVLTRYVKEGGRLLIFAEFGGAPLLPELLDAWGLQLEPGLVADARVNPEQPYMVFTPFFGEHEIMAPLSRAQSTVFFHTTLAITKLATEGVTVTPLVLTTPYAWVDATLSEKPTRDDGERTGQLILAAVSSKPTDPALPARRSGEGRILLFGDSNLLSNTIGEAANRDLVLNTIAFSTLQMRKITIRPPDRDLSTVDLTDETLSQIRLVSMVLLPTLLLSIGLTIWNLRRAR